MGFQNISDESSPSRPNYRRRNFTDIRSMQVYDPVCIGNNQDITAAWTALAGGTGAGTTLENGIRIKNASPDDTPIWVTVETAETASGPGTGATSAAGFKLDQAEEVFIEVRRAADVWVIGETTSIATYIAS